MLMFTVGGSVSKPQSLGASLSLLCMSRNTWI